MEGEYGVEVLGAWACLVGTGYRCLWDCSGCSRAVCSCPVAGPFTQEIWLLALTSLAFSPALLLAASLPLLAVCCPRKAVTRGFWLPEGVGTQVGKERSSTA